MNNLVELTIVIPTHNSSEYIKKTLDNISSEMEKDKPSYEIIIVDDFSEDIENLKFVLNDYKNINLITKKSKSNAADSRNLGFESSLGEFVFFLDSDDNFLPDYINRRVNLHKEKKAGVIFGRFLSNNSISKMKDYDYGSFREYLFGGNGDIRSSTISICKHYYKKTMFDKKQNKHQDWGFGILCYDNNESLYFDPIAGVNIDSTLNKFRMSNKSNLSATEYFLKKFNLVGEKKYFFIRMHIVSAILKGDKNAVVFYREMIRECYGETNINFKFKLFILHSLSYMPSSILKLMK